MSLLLSGLLKWVFFGTELWTVLIQEGILNWIVTSRTGIESHLSTLYLKTRSPTLQLLTQLSKSNTYTGPLSPYSAVCLHVTVKSLYVPSGSCLSNGRLCQRASDLPWLQLLLWTQMCRPDLPWPRVWPEHRAPPQKTSAAAPPLHHPGCPQTNLSPEHLQEEMKEADFFFLSWFVCSSFYTCTIGMRWYSLGNRFLTQTLFLRMKPSAQSQRKEPSVLIQMSSRPWQASTRSLHSSMSEQRKSKGDWRMQYLNNTQSGVLFFKICNYPNIWTLSVCIPKHISCSEPVHHPYSPHRQHHSLRRQ